MNIREHIEAGHYPTDEKGRALVPMRNGKTATICATDCPFGGGVVGWDGDDLNSWDGNGHYHEGSVCLSRIDLLPPPPRKVPKRAWLLVRNGEDYDTTHNPATAEMWRESIKRAEIDRTEGDLVVELTGEIEEPWS